MATAGQRNRIATIERLSDTPDRAGGATRVWSAVSTEWVAANPVALKEGLIAGTLQSSQGWRIEMCFRDDLTVRDRLRADWLPAGKAIGIRSVTDLDGRRQRLIVFGETEPI